MNLALVLAVALVFATNLPFGYWRAGLPKRSLPWLIAIHAPVPIVWLIRDLLDLDWRWSTLPLFVGAYFLGQWIGGRLRLALAPRTAPRTGGN